MRQVIEAYAMMRMPVPHKHDAKSVKKDLGDSPAEVDVQCVMGIAV